MYKTKNFAFPGASKLKDKVVVITGANSGLGFHTMEFLAKHGAKLVMACRSMDRAEQARQEILKQFPKAEVVCVPLDLASFDSIQSFPALLKAQNINHIDLLLNNAGVMALTSFTLTANNLEFQMGANHYGHFLLTALLFPMLAKNSRIINHSSAAHILHTKQFPFKDANPSASDEYRRWRVYGNSKQANLLFTYALNRRLAASGNPKNIKVIAVHPGYSSTNLTHGTFPLNDLVDSIIAMDGRDGAKPQIYACTTENVESSMNNYIGPCCWIFGYPVEQSTLSSSWSHEAQDTFWKTSVDITKQDFDFGK